MAMSAPSPAIRTATATPPTAARQAGSFSVEDGQRRERSAIRVATDVGDREKSMNTGWFESAKQAGTKGGEALPGAVTGECWYVLWTHSNSEQLVHNQLAAKGFQLFLPNIDAWHRRGGVRALARVPLFPGYLFVHRVMDKSSYIEICKTRGLVRVLGERWDQLD